MGRKAGGKNFENLNATTNEPVMVTVEESNGLSKVFTKIDKDFISISDLVDASGLSYDMCAKIIREIKAVSDSFHISGFVHRVDYFSYFLRRQKIMEAQ